MAKFENLEEMEVKLKELKSNFSISGFLLEDEVNDLFEIAEEYKGWFKVASLMIENLKDSD